MIQLKEKLLLAEKADTLYVLDIDSGRVHSFNLTAKVIFQLCMQPIEFDELVQEFLGYFPIDPAEAAEDIRQILELLGRYDLLAHKERRDG
jgi:hypothetical protein